MIVTGTLAEIYRALAETTARAAGATATKTVGIETAARTLVSSMTHATSNPAHGFRVGYAPPSTTTRANPKAHDLMSQYWPSEYEHYRIPAVPRNPTPVYVPSASWDAVTGRYRQPIPLPAFSNTAPAAIADYVRDARGVYRLATKETSAQLRDAWRAEMARLGLDPNMAMIHDLGDGRSYRIRASTGTVRAPIDYQALKLMRPDIYTALRVAISDPARKPFLRIVDIHDPATVVDDLSEPETSDE